MKSPPSLSNTFAKLGRPFTASTIVLLVVFFLVLGYTPSLGPHFVFDPKTVVNSPWTLVTYPLGGNGIVGTLFGVLWLYMIGNRVERDVYSLRYAIATAVFVLIVPLTLWGCSAAFGVPVQSQGIWLLMSAVTVAWGTRDPDEVIKLWMLVPVKAKWLAWASIALAFLQNPPILAPFAAAPLILVWLFASNRLPFRYSGRAAAQKMQDGRGRTVTIEFMDEIKKREKKRAEEERLKKLFGDE